MTSVARKSSARRLALLSTGILLYATGALAARAAFDPQEQARHFIVAKPSSESVADTKTSLTAIGAAQNNGRVDPQEQARQFILGQPSPGFAVDSKGKVTLIGSLRGPAGVDPLEQAREFILATAAAGRPADHAIAPVSKKQVTSAQSDRRHRDGQSESR